MSEIIDNLQKRNDLIDFSLKRQIPQKYRDTLDLYFRGMDYKEIAKKLGITENLARTRVSRLRKLGLIGEKQTKTKTVMELLKIGINDTDQIAKILEISHSAAYSLKVEANIKLKEYSENLGIKAKKEIKNLHPSLIPEIKRALSYMYPTEIAEAYDVSVREIYDVIYSLNDEEKSDIKKRALKRNNLYKRVKDLKESKNISAKEAIEEISKDKLSVNDIIEKARIYYIAGDYIKAQRILMKTAYDNKVSVQQRILAREEADKMYFNNMVKLVRKEYITRKPNGELVYFDDIMEKYKVGYEFLREVIGPEDGIKFNDIEL